MYRKVIGLTISLSILVMLVLAAPAGAHPVVVGDTSRADWFAKGPPEPNNGAIVRDSAGRGEYVWSDARGDQRQASTIGATGDITREADLTRFSVTADASNIYFLAKVEHYSGIKNDPALQLMISIDRDHAANSGEVALPDGVNTNVGATAAWEYVVQSRFSKGTGGTGVYAVSAAPWVYSSPTVTQTVGSGQLVTSSANGGGYAELAVPWSAIGGLPASQSFLRFTVSTYYSDHRGANGNPSLAIDTLSSTGASAELSDGTIDSAVDLHFTATGEVFAPLLISEFLPDPPGSSDPKGEWIELYNPNSFDVSLKGYKVGDQPYRGGSQGMAQLPDQLLAAGQAVVVANDIATFKKNNPTLNLPAAQLIDLATLPAYTSWGTGKVSLQNENKGAAFKESLALLDPSDTIVDLVQYAFKTATGPTGLDPDVKPIVLTGTAVGPNASYDRCPSGSDTNDGGIDFFVRTTGQNPGTPCVTVPGVDLRIAKDGPDIVDGAAGTPIQYVIPFSNAGSSAASNVVITDTLPAEMSFSGQSASAGVVFAGQNGQTLTWTIASVPSQASGSITLNVTLAGTVAPDTALTNSVGIISTPAEADATRHNNVATQTLITTGPPDLTLNTSWAQASGVGPGQTASFAIIYENAGENDANDITIVDTLPAGATFVSAEPAPASVQGNVLTWKVPSLTYLETGSIKVNLQIGAGVPIGTLLTNSAAISSNPPDLDRPDEHPDSELSSLMVGHQLFMPVAAR